MMKFCDCDFCIHSKAFVNGHVICDAFPDGVPYEHMDKDLEKIGICNNDIGFEPRERKSNEQ